MLSAAFWFGALRVSFGKKYRLADHIPLGVVCTTTKCLQENISKTTTNSFYKYSSFYKEWDVINFEIFTITPNNS